MKPWTRDNTKFWITQLEQRIKDIDYYLKKTLEWCEDHYIYDDRKVFILSFLTVIWVSNMRDEPISYVELLEILGLENMIVGEDRIYDIGPTIANLTFEQMLAVVIKDLN